MLLDIASWATCTRSQLWIAYYSANLDFVYQWQWTWLHLWCRCGWMSVNQCYCMLYLVNRWSSGYRAEISFWAVGPTQRNGWSTNQQAIWCIVHIASNDAYVLFCCTSWKLRLKGQVYIVRSRFLNVGTWQKPCFLVSSLLSQLDSSWGQPLQAQMSIHQAVYGSFPNNRFIRVAMLPSQGSLDTPSDCECVACTCSTRHTGFTNAKRSRRTLPQPIL